MRTDGERLVRLHRQIERAEARLAEMWARRRELAQGVMGGGSVSKSELARIVGVSRQAVQRWLRPGP